MRSAAQVRLLQRMQRLWALHRLSAPVGFTGRAWLAVALVVLTLGGLLLIFRPVGKPERVYGRVVGYGGYETETGTQPVLVVRVGGRAVRDPVRSVLGCQVGDRVTLRKSRTLVGEVYSSSPRTCVRGAAAADLGPAGPLSQLR
jgi:hypothetical protein